MHAKFICNYVLNGDISKQEKIVSTSDGGDSMSYELVGSNISISLMILIFLVNLWSDMTSVSQYGQITLSQI